MTRILSLLILLALPVVAWSQDCVLPKQAESYELLFSQYMHRKCFGGDADSSDIKKRTDAAIESMQKSVVTGEDYRALRQQAAQALTALAGSLRDQQTVTDDAWRERLSHISRRLEQAAAETAVAERDIRAGDWNVEDLTIFDGSYSIVEPLKQDCANGYTRECQQAQQFAAAILRHSALANEVLGRVVKTVRLETKYADLKILDDQWTYYWKHGRSQYPWELIVNKVRFDRAHPDPNQFAGPPSDQIILMHFDAAIEYAKPRNEDGTEFNAVALVEVIGYNRLSYAADGKAGRSYGASIIATVSPESGGNRFGWGVMLHATDKLSIGVARRDLGRGDDETVWLMSADLAKLFNLTSQEAQKKFRVVGDSSSRK